MSNYRKKNCPVQGFQITNEQKFETKTYMPPDEWVLILQPSDNQLVVKTTKPPRRAINLK